GYGKSNWRWATVAFDSVPMLTKLLKGFATVVVSPVVSERYFGSSVLRSKVPVRCSPREPEYPISSNMEDGNCCCTSRFHCIEYGVGGLLFQTVSAWPSCVATPSDFPAGCINPCGNGLRRRFAGVRPPSFDVFQAVLDEYPRLGTKPTALLLISSGA